MSSNTVQDKEVPSLQAYMKALMLGANIRKVHGAAAMERFYTEIIDQEFPGLAVIQPSPWTDEKGLIDYLASLHGDPIHQPIETEFSDGDYCNGAAETNDEEPETYPYDSIFDTEEIPV